MENQPTFLVEEKDPDETYFVYLISDPLTDEPVYVGQAISVMVRIGQHISSFHKGNPRLQSKFDYWNVLLKFPKIQILEVCKGYSINAREKYWINHYCSLYSTMTNIKANPILTLEKESSKPETYKKAEKEVVLDLLKEK